MSKRNVRNVNDVDENICIRSEGIEETFHGWWGMPEYSHSEYQYSTVVFTFDSDEDVADFAEKTGMAITEKTRSMWYPEIPYAKDADYKWMET